MRRAFRFFYLTFDIAKFLHGNEKPWMELELTVSRF